MKTQDRILHRSLPGRFQLADYAEVAGASLDNGLLTVDLVRKLPDEKKPRRIVMQTGEALPKGEALQIEGEKQAA